jgi:nucleotide-binding universal stress UspA family protein
MDSTVGRRPVVVGYDSSGEGDPAFDWALREGRLRDLPVHVLVARSFLYAANPTPAIAAAAPVPEDLTPARVAQARAYAEAHAPGTSVVIESALGSPASFLVEASRTAELVVVGRRHHTAVGEAVAGSTSTQVVAHAQCPVVVVDRDVEAPEDGPIVVAVDGSPANEAAIAFGFERAARLGLPLVAVHAWWLDVPDRLGLPWLTEEKLADIEQGHQRMLERSVADWALKYPDVEVRQVLTRSLPVEAVLEQAQDAQLIVVGSRGHGGFVGLLIGSVSQGLLHHDRPCPLVVVHAEE